MACYRLEAWTAGGILAARVHHEPRPPSRPHPAAATDCATPEGRAAGQPLALRGGLAVAGLLGPEVRGVRSGATPARCGLRARPDRHGPRALAPPRWRQLHLAAVEELPAAQWRAP